MTNPNLLSPWVYFPIHCWGYNRNYPSKLIIRYCATRHLLCSSTFPLRLIHRSSLCHYGWTNTLIPTIYRIYTKPNHNKNSILSNIYWSKPDILSTALPRFIGHTTTIFRLPRRLHLVKYSLINWFNNLNGSRTYIPIYCLRSTHTQTKSPLNTWKKNSYRMILWDTTPTPHPYGTYIYTKQHIRPNSKLYHLHRVTLTREKAALYTTIY